MSDHAHAAHGHGNGRGMAGKNVILFITDQERAIQHFPPEWAERKDGSYAFQGIFLAGWRPSVSPFDGRFDRWAIDRVRSEGKIKEDDCKQFCSTAWLDYLDKHPDERYTSDGDPNTVTFPNMLEDRLGKPYRAWARVY